jgi:hypothetical protein
VIRSANRGLGLFVRREGSIENVLFNNTPIRSSQAAEGTTTFLRHRDVAEAERFANNDLTKAATAITPLPSPFATP